MPLNVTVNVSDANDKQVLALYYDSAKSAVSAAKAIAKGLTETSTLKVEVVKMYTFNDPTPNVTAKTTVK